MAYVLPILAILGIAISMFFWIRKKRHDIWFDREMNELAISYAKNEKFHQLYVAVQEAYGLPKHKKEDGAYLYDEGADLVGFITRECLRRSQRNVKTMSEDEVFASNILMFIIADAVSQIGRLPFEELTIDVASRLWQTQFLEGQLGVLIRETANEFNNFSDDKNRQAVKHQISQMVIEFINAVDDTKLDQLAKSLLYFMSNVSYSKD